MDPFSVLAGAVGVADVGFRLIKYLAEVKSASSKIQGEVDALETEIKSLLGVNQSVEEFYRARQDETNAGALSVNSGDLAKLWKPLASLLQQTKPIIQALNDLLVKIIGKPGSIIPGKLDGLRKTIRKLNKDGEYMQIRQRLLTNQSSIQMSLSALNIAYIHKTENAQQLALSKLSDNLQQLYTGLHSKATSVREEARGLKDTDAIDRSLASVDEVVSRVRFNEYFEVPQSVSSNYTGRQKELRELASALNVAHSRERQTHQKRFVIYGLGGSGKTQFCCKFAQDNRDRYWGVFWIDGSSYETARHSFSKIAKLKGLEPNENAAKSWLSSEQHPWLLLIDNADGTDVDLMRLCPSGERGVILITTRNPSNKRHGTEGPCFFQFDKLETREATDLVLATAVVKRPWGDRTRKYADRIARILGYLPLALVHAGMAILDSLCSLSEYPEYYERTWNKIRNPRTRRTSLGQKEELPSNMSVYASYEIIYVGLESKKDQQSSDALGLLRVFSFLHSDNIDFGMMKAAAMNPRREREASQVIEETARLYKVYAKPKTWGELFREWVMAIRASLQAPCDPLPEVLRDDDDTPFDEDRLRSALSLLVRLGMLSLYGESSYSMHPLVHTWVRRRPGTSTAEQAVWCQAAVTVLMQSIFLRPPSEYAAQDENLKRLIYPHVETVRRFQEDIKDQFADNRKRYRRPWPWAWFPPPLKSRQGSFGRAEAIEYAKFSLVYLFLGQWSEAETLQIQVKDFIFANLGPDSERGIDIALLLSINYGLQTLKNKARALQYEVLESARRYYGPDHPRTLQIMDTLGATCLDCSRLREAHQLHQEAITKLTALKGFGPEHEHTLTAIHNLSKVKARYFDYEEGFDLALKAYTGMKKVLGDNHQKTLDAKIELATLYGFKGEQYHADALRMAEEVTLIRSKSLGREHPLTLISRLTEVKFKTAMGHLAEAEQLMKEGIRAAERSLGKTHLGTLLGWNYFGHVYWRWGRYDEAAKIWENVIQTGHYAEVKRAEGEHTDRVQAMWFLVHCREDQGQISEALKICQELVELIRDFGGEGLGQQHKFWGYVNEKKEELLKLGEQERERMKNCSGAIVATTASASASPPSTPATPATFSSSIIGGTASTSTTPPSTPDISTASVIGRSGSGSGSGTAQPLPIPPKKIVKGFTF
ncbi:hypothetical protein BDV06DRAFT_220835 [Aspergillus oleicola]